MARLLEVDSIDTFYGRSQVLFGMGLAIDAGEVVTLMGRNGMGKTTTIRSIMGLTPASQGAIRFRGSDIRGLPSYRVAKVGIGLVPERSEERRVGKECVSTCRSRWAPDN